MKKKLSLGTIEVQSFVTTLTDTEKNGVKGQGTETTCPIDTFPPQYCTYWFWCPTGIKLCGDTTDDPNCTELEYC